jgi:transcriptional regulator with XRE-family HTH domain
MESENNFTVLDNKSIGKNILLYRKMRGIKAMDIAERLGVNESTYGRYERGETMINIETLQKISEILKVDPLSLLSASPNNFFENGSNSPNVGFASHGSYYNKTTNEQQSEMMLKLMQNLMSLNERLISLLEKKNS